MNKLNSSEFGERSAQKQRSAAVHWEKVQADGKWFWIFKRAAIWLSIILSLYGAGGILFPFMFDFQSNQLLILSGMFGAFLVNSIIEWSKIEKNYQRQNETS